MVQTPTPLLQIDNTARALAFGCGGHRLGPLAAAAGVRVNGRIVSVAGAPEQVEGTTATWRADGLTLRVHYAEVDGALHIAAQLVNETAGEILVDHLDPLVVGAGGLTLGAGVADWRILRHGWQSWSATRYYRATERDNPPRFDFLLEMEENIANPSPGEPGVFLGEQVACIREAAGGAALALGFLTCRTAFGDFRVEVEGSGLRSLRARCRFDGAALAPGATLAAEALILRFGDAADDPLERVAAAIGEAMQARVPERSPVGWCSWYYFYTKVDEPRLLANLDQLAVARERLGLEVFQLDDGYQKAIGDWLTPNEKFPGGLPALAERIAGAGFMPGIWTAPFLVDPRSDLARAHPDWILRDDRGRPVRGAYNPIWTPWRNIHALDPSHPDCRAWLIETFAAFRAMGWRFFKIDFLYAAVLPSVRFDKSFSRAGALRAGLEAIRRGVGDDALILGCGCPLGPAVGIADIMRIGPDVTPAWANPMRPVLRDHHCLSTLHAARNTLNRAFLHRRFWLNDPDCVLVRQNKNRLTDEEMRTFASLAAVSGGMFLLSDDVTAYPAERWAMLETALACRAETMRVLDPADGEFPSRTLSPAPDGYLALWINFANRPRAAVFEPRDWLAADEVARLVEVRDVWADRTADARDGRYPLGDIAPHGCRLLRLTLRSDGGVDG